MSSDAQSNSNLDHVSVAAPCNAKWSEMSGDDRARFCKLCSKHVYHLSAMNRAEAEALIKEKEGKVCVRFYRRADGKVLTENCPVGLRTLRDQMKWVGAGIAALFALSASCAAAAFGSSRNVSFKHWFVEGPSEGVMGQLRPSARRTTPSSGTTGATAPCDSGG